MKKTFSAVLAIATVAGSLAVMTPAANARGGAVAAGVVGGLLGGALIGSAIANSQPAYAAPAPVYAAPPAYIEEPPCHFARERFWDGYGWRFRRIRVCD
jgi:hypothetical protein